MEGVGCTRGERVHSCKAIETFITSASYAISCKVLDKVFVDIKPSSAICEGGMELSETAPCKHIGTLCPFWSALCTMNLGHLRQNWPS
jgi:hypothetical protein